MKRVFGLICLVCVFLFGTLTANAEVQQVIVSGTEDAIRVDIAGEGTAWELPSLRPGEALNEPSTLVLDNQTAVKQTVQLTAVELPFEDAAALAFLNRVHITVKDGDAVLYSGAYSRINDGGLKLVCKLAPGETHEYTVDLRAEYDAPNATLSTPIEWKFAAVTKTEIEKPEEKADDAFSDPALRDMLLAAGAAVLLLVGVGAYEIVKRKKNLP